MMGIEDAVFCGVQALEALRGEQTIAQLAAKHGVHQTMINTWKKQAVEGIATVFSGKAEAADTARESGDGAGHAEAPAAGGVVGMAFGQIEGGHGRGSLIRVQGRMKVSPARRPASTVTP